MGWFAVKWIRLRKNGIHYWKMWYISAKPNNYGCFGLFRLFRVADQIKVRIFIFRIERSYYQRALAIFRFDS